MVRLDVQEPPSWIIKPSDLRGAELDKVEFKCEALGSPPPQYTWVDKDGLDATEKEGEKSPLFISIDGLGSGSGSGSGSSSGSEL